MALCLSGRGNFRLINTVFFSVVFKIFLERISHEFEGIL